MDGDMIILVLIVGGFIGFGIYKSIKKSNLIASGEATKRNKKDLLKKAQIFTTNIKSPKKVYEKLEEADLSRHKINMEYSADRIIFTKSRMVTSLRSLGDGKYKLAVDTYIQHRTNGIKSGVDNLLEMNIIFTAVEKAILALDKNADVEEEFIKRS